MVNIIDEIEKRSKYFLPVLDFDPVYLSADVNEDIICLIMSERHFLRAIKQRPDILKEYYLCGLFDLGECYSPYVDLRFSLYIFTKTEQERIKTSVYRESIYIAEKPKGYNICDNIGNNHLLMPQNYCDTYLYYLDDLEKWINLSVEPLDSFYANYNDILPIEYQIDEPYSARYSKQSMLIYEKLKKEDTVELSLLADIIEPDENDTKSAPANYLWNYTEFEYPLKESYFRSINYGEVMNFQLKKGDILLSSAVGEYQINFIPEELPNNIYCPTNTTVVRPKENVSAYYLFLYLHSETGKIIIGNKHRGSVIQYLSPEEIRTLPIIRPERSDSSYKKLFEEIFLNQQKIDIFSECYRKCSKTTLEDILNDELILKAKNCRNILAKKIIETDIQEINSCFEVGAYKATLIMAGSVLEAFLIDWLSELHGKDYFSEKILKDDGTEANLFNIINMIKTIKAPEWMIEAKHAHTIRTKRNLVHAKLCLNEAEKINATLCKKVIKYLSQIIETRYKKR